MYEALFINVASSTIPLKQTSYFCTSVSPIYLCEYIETLTYSHVCTHTYRCMYICL